MGSIPIALVIGLVAGTIDILPMVAQKMDRYSCISAFAHWVALGLIIPFVGWDMAPWLKGLIIGELTAIPIIILVFPTDPKALVPMLGFSAILGAGVGIAGARFIG